MIDIDFDTFRLVVLASFCGTLLALLLASLFFSMSKRLGDGFFSVFVSLVFMLGIVTFLAWPILADLM